MSYYWNNNLISENWENGGEFLAVSRRPSPDIRTLENFAERGINKREVFGQKGFYRP
jgi:hypothetical protein